MTLETTLLNQIATVRHEIDALERLLDYGLDDDDSAEDELEARQAEYGVLLDLLEEHRRRESESAA
jgi:hypothetical protein